MGRQHPGGRGARHGRDRADALGPQLRSLRQSAQLRGARQGRQRQHAEVSLSLYLTLTPHCVCEQGSRGDCTVDILDAAVLLSTKFAVRLAFVRGNFVRFFLCGVLVFKVRKW